MQRKTVIQTLFTLPSFLLFITFFVVPFTYFFVVSFWQVRLFKLRPDFSFDNYKNVATEYLDPLLFTLAIALTISVSTTFFALAVAYLIRFKAGRFGAAMLFVTLLTMFGGYLVKIYAWKTILGTTGILNTALLELGLITESLPWLLYNPGAVVVTLVHFLLPFAILPIYGALRSVEDIEIDGARDLGARPFRVLADIILPRCQTGLMVAFALTFLISAGDYVTPRLVGGPHTAMIGNFVESQFVMRFNAPQGSALAFTILVTSVVTVAILFVAMRRTLRPR